MPVHNVDRCYLWDQLLVWGVCWENRPSLNNFSLKNTYSVTWAWWIDFSEDWKILYVIRIYNTYHWYIDQYQLSNAYDLSSLQLTSSTYMDYCRSSTVNIRNSWNNLYVQDEINDKIKQFSLSTPYQINTNSYVRNSANPWSYWYASWMSKDMKYLYIQNWYTNSYLAWFILSTPWDISTKSEFCRRTTSYRDYMWIPFISGDGSRAIIQYWQALHSWTLSTPRDISTFQEDWVLNQDWVVYYDWVKNLFIWYDNKIFHYVC